MKKWTHQFSLLLIGALTPLFLAAADSRSTPAKDPATARLHWAYQPIQLPPLPPVRQQKLTTSPIDNFVLTKLEGKKLSLAWAADRRTLIRRAYYDLIGFPPTFEEIEAFAKDRSRDAFAKVVDRLLASPRYGERWGRHWLDVARYAETKDLVLLYGKDRLRPFAYTYRDYVIRAFNLDTPFDQFVREQLAADQIEPKVEPWRLGALGFLTLGRLFDNNPHDQIDDQIDTVSRGLLGLTVACARCHDHKYDAIPTADYYSLYGVFASSERPYDLPLIEDPARVVGGTDFETKFAGARKNLEDHIDAEFAKISDTARRRVTDYLVRVATTKPDIGEEWSYFLSLSPEDLRPSFIYQWRRYVRQHAQRDDPVFGLWAELMALPDENFSARARELLSQRTGQETAHEALAAERQLQTGNGVSAKVNPLILDAFIKSPPASKTNVAQIYGEVLRRVYEHSRYPGNESASWAESLDQDERDLLAIHTSKESPVYFPRSQTPTLMSRVEADRFGSLVQALDKLAAHATNPPPARAMVLADTHDLYAPRVFVRGNPAKPDQPVPRAFLQVLSREHREPFAHGSGRLDLANAITSPDNPLTARVFVNRVWMHHFGEPLVNSPGDFGARSEPPTNPELLDFLAWRFIHDGWSIKKLHRLIMLSATYQQGSARASLASVGALPAEPGVPRPTAIQESQSTSSRNKVRDVASRTAHEARALPEQIDPDNKLLWHFPRRRLDLEAMRDTLLFVSGRLDLTMGGRSSDIASDALNCRRTVYGLVDRQDLPGMFRAFDFAVPDQCVDRRPRTSVPQQALFVMNSSFAIEQAKALAALAAEISSDPLRAVMLYIKILGRVPAQDEVGRAVQFIHEAEGDAGSGSVPQLAPWEQFAQVLLMSNELMFVE
ncbi:MAG: DUF1549 domain-containing protein [Verrucomicrobia bacterium]|nr:DUF1549 domain-containing protein [Verrucomicrobiota bacterium]